MKVFTHINPLKDYLKNQRGSSIGYVPTMGALHKGHAALCKESVANNDITVCSIFVNPEQFNNKNDLENYPRTLEADQEILREQECNVLFVPDINDIYPGQLELKMELSGFATILEGQYRPGHFQGVALVVLKMLNIIMPDRAYFGLKDLQQCYLIKKMVRELFLDTQIVCLSTVREPNGLAFSSRNTLLTKEEQELASHIYSGLTLGKELLLQGNLVNQVKLKVKDYICGTNPIRLEYLELVNLENFSITDSYNPGTKHALCIAAYLGEVRLIDNIILEEDAG